TTKDVPFLPSASRDSGLGRSGRKVPRRVQAAPATTPFRHTWSRAEPKDATLRWLPPQHWRAWRPKETRRWWYSCRSASTAPCQRHARRAQAGEKAAWAVRFRIEQSCACLTLPNLAQAPVHQLHVAPRAELVVPHRPDLPRQSASQFAWLRNGRRL